MIEGGFILQPRKIDKSAISGCPPHVREIWFYLLRKANHKDVQCRGRSFKRGQLITTYSEIIEALSWHVGYRKERYKKHHCEVALKALTKAIMITTARTTRGIIVTICNYDYYQDPKNYQTDRENYRRTTGDRQSNDTINNNDKKKKEKSINNTLMSEIAGATPDGLDDFEKQALSFWKLFLNNMKTVNHKPTVLMSAKLGPWAEHIRLMHSSDKRTAKEMTEVFNFLKEDQFWKINCRSTNQLRDQFDNILIKARAKKLAPVSSSVNSGPKDPAQRPFKFKDRN